MNLALNYSKITGQEFGNYHYQTGIWYGDLLGALANIGTKTTRKLYFLVLSSRLKSYHKSYQAEHQSLVLVITKKMLTRNTQWIDTNFV